MKYSTFNLTIYNRITSTLNKSNLIYIDTIYNPLETKTLKYLKNQNRKVFNGLEMFIYQGQKAFNIWHNVEPEINKELIEFLKN